jgi:hypothetical protein
LFSIVIVAAFYLVTLFTPKYIVQYSPDHMKWMRFIQVLQAAQKRLGLTEKLFDVLQERPDKPQPTDRPSANEEENNTFCQVFWGDMLANRQRPGLSRRYHAETYAAAFILRAMSSRGDQFLRHKLIPLPTINHVDDYSRSYIDEAEAQITNIEQALHARKLQRTSPARIFSVHSIQAAYVCGRSDPLHFGS